MENWISMPLAKKSLSHFQTKGRFAKHFQQPWEERERVKGGIDNDHLDVSTRTSFW